MYNKSKDLIIVTLYGFIYYAIVIGLNGHLTRVPLGEYFIFPFLLACFMGIMISRPSQMLEWPLCFLFGGTLGTIGIVTVLSILGMEFTVLSIVAIISHTLAWFGTVSVMILAGLLLGTFFKATLNLIFGSLHVKY